MSRINHSVCRWCYGSTPLEDLCIAAKNIGISSIELVMPDDMAVLEKHGLSCAMISFPVGKMADGTEVGLIEKAFNRLEHHDTLVEIYQPHLKAADIVARHVSRYEFAQAVCRPGFYDMLPGMGTSVRGFYMADTSFYYPEDRSINESIVVGRNLAARALSDLSGTAAPQ